MKKNKILYFSSTYFIITSKSKSKKNKNIYKF